MPTGGALRKTPSSPVRKRESVKKEGAPFVSSSSEKVSLWTRLNVRLSEKERVLFAKYLSVLIESGLPLSQAIEVLASQSTGPTKVILTTVLQDIRNGRSLAHGLGRFPHVFSGTFVNLVKAGEKSGTLQENLEYVSVQSQKQYELKQSLKGALMYPMLVLGGGILTSVLIVVFIFPNIIALFKSLDVELPFTTRILLAVATFFEAYPRPITFGLFVFLVLFIASRKILATRRVWDAVLLRVPVIGALIRNSILANVFRLLGTLLKSGLPLKDAIHITRSTILNAPYQKLFSLLEERITQGSELTLELEKHPRLVPPLAQRLVHVGNETGTLNKMLLYLADFYAKEVDEISKRIAVLMEPMLIILIGALVGFLALSVISPIYQVVSSI